jgi:hypothetical protein
MVMIGTAMSREKKIQNKRDTERSNRVGEEGRRGVEIMMKQKKTAARDDLEADDRANHAEAPLLCCGGPITV